MYILARNGLAGPGTEKIFNERLIPLIKEKKDWLHAEGVSQTVFALSEAGSYDPEIWGLLKNLIATKEFECRVVKPLRWQVDVFTTLSGKEHFFQGETTKFANQLFFQDKLL